MVINLFFASAAEQNGCELKTKNGVRLIILGTIPKKSTGSHRYANFILISKRFVYKRKCTEMLD